MFKNILIIFISITSFAAEKKDYTKAELQKNVEKAVVECRTRIKAIDGQNESLWNPKLGILEFKKKEKLKEIKRLMPFSNYLYLINDLKIKSTKKKTELDNLIKGWTEDIHALNMKVSEDLRAFSSYCFQPTNAILKYIDDLKGLAKK